MTDYTLPCQIIRRACSGDVFYHIISYSFSMALNLALRALGFDFISSAEGITGFFVKILIVSSFPHTHTGKPGGQIHLLA